MCGACTRPHFCGADVVLRTAYGQHTAAKLVSQIDRVTVQATGTGWIVQSVGRSTRLAQTAAELFAALSPWVRDSTAPVLEHASVSEHRASLLRMFRRTGPHRPLDTPRTAFPSAAVLPAADAAPAHSDEVIHQVLAAGLSAVGAAATVTVKDDAGSWCLRVV